MTYTFEYGEEDSWFTLTEIFPEAKVEVTRMILTFKEREFHEGVQFALGLENMLKFYAVCVCLHFFFMNLGYPLNTEFHSHPMLRSGQKVCVQWMGVVVVCKHIPNIQSK